LTAPIGQSLLRLAGPTTGLMVVQIFVAIAEIWFIARLGADALAGFALVLPFPGVDAQYGQRRHGRRRSPRRLRGRWAPAASRTRARWCCTRWFWRQPSLSSSPPSPGRRPPLSIA